MNKLDELSNLDYVVKMLEREVCTTGQQERLMPCFEAGDEGCTSNNVPECLRRIRAALIAAVDTGREGLGWEVASFLASLVMGMDELWDPAKQHVDDVLEWAIAEVEKGA